MEITFKQFRALTTHELYAIFHEAEREIEARNQPLSDGRFVHDNDVTDSDIDKLLRDEQQDTKAWYVLRREQEGRAEPRT